MLITPVTTVQIKHEWWMYLWPSRSWNYWKRTVTAKADKRFKSRVFFTSYWNLLHFIYYDNLIIGKYKLYKQQSQGCTDYNYNKYKLIGLLMVISTVPTSVVSLAFDGINI